MINSVNAKKAGLLAILAVAVILFTLPAKENSKTSIRSLLEKTKQLESGNRIPNIDTSWKRIFEQARASNLKLTYAHEGEGDKKYSPSEILENDELGYRRAILTGSPLKTLSTVGFLQREIPIEIEGFRFSDAEFSVDIEMFIKVRGSTQ